MGLLEVAEHCLEFGLVILRLHSTHFVALIAFGQQAWLVPKQ